MELFSGLARGAYLVCIGWTTLVISNDVATVGQIYVVSSLTFVLAGPIVGVIIDRHKRKQLIMLAQFFIAASILCIGGFLFFAPDLSIWWLFGVVVIVTVFRVMYRGSFDGIIRASVENPDILHTIARANAIHLVLNHTCTVSYSFKLLAAHWTQNETSPNAEDRRRRT